MNKQKIEYKYDIDPKNYSKLKPVIQVNLDYFDYFKADRDIYVSKFMETTLHIPENEFWKMTPKKLCILAEIYRPHLPPS